MCTTDIDCRCSTSPAPESSDGASDASSLCWHNAACLNVESGRAFESYGLHDIPDSVFLGNSGGRLQYFHNGRGLRIASYWWPAIGRARATVVVMHGNGVYLPFAYLSFQGPGLPSAYEGSWVEALNVRGFSVCGIDMQSCGRSEGVAGLRAYLASYKDVIQDQLQFIQMVRACGNPSFSRPPLFIIGASFGGCVATHCAYALQDQNWFKGCVLLAAMLSLHPNPSMNVIYECVGRAISCVAPALPLVSGNVKIMMERIPDLYQGYQQDPGVYRGPTRAGVVLEYILAVNALRASVPAMTFPVLALHSPDDTLTDIRGSRELIALSAAKDKTFQATPGMWHDLIQEPGNDAVYRVVLDWLEARTPE